MKRKGRNSYAATLPCLLLLSLVAGCAQPPVTDNAVTFLRLQLVQSAPGEPYAGWLADYVGRVGGYHLMKVRYSNYMKFPALWEGPFHEEMHRCPAAALPDGYPQDLVRDLAGWQEQYWNNQLKPATYYQHPRGDIADRVICEYLQKHGKLTPELKAELDRKPE